MPSASKCIAVHFLDVPRFLWLALCREELDLPQSCVPGKFFLLTQILQLPPLPLMIVLKGNRLPKKTSIMTLF